MISAEYFKTNLYWPTSGNSTRSTNIIPNIFTIDVNPKNSFKPLIDPFRQNLVVGTNIKVFIY